MILLAILAPLAVLHFRPSVGFAAAAKPLSPARSGHFFGSFCQHRPFFIKRLWPRADLPTRV
jgi:hypothetical protein